MSLLLKLLETVVRKLVSVVTTVTGIEKKTPKVSGDDEKKSLIFSDLQPCVQLFSTEPVTSEKHFLAEEIMLSRSDFPIQPADLVERCKVGASQYR